MLRKGFSEHIRQLEKDVTDMSRMVVKAIEHSVKALCNRDVEEAKRIVNDDAFINQKRWEIEEKCIQLIATQQPVASDLREIIALISIITELERMGDYAEGIGKIVIMLGTEPLIKALVDIPRMAEIGVDMLKRSIDAFLKRDAEAAKAICADDDKVDLLHEQVYRVFLSYMIENPRVITRATYLIWAAHNLERIADRVTNICERIVFLVTGSMHEKINVSRY